MMPCINTSKTNNLLLLQLPESPNFKVELTLNVKQGGGPQSQFYLLDIGSCWKNNGAPCDGDVLTDVTRYSEMIDPFLADMVDGISIKGRYKSRFSTMKKLLKDGRKPEEVNDILGLRIILYPRPGDDAKERGDKACYRTRELIQSLWKEIPHRAKDYIARPKPNGYRSLHMAVDVSDDDRTRPLMEIQIRTTEMDAMADGGTASHSLYKGGLTDPEEVNCSLFY